MCQGQGWWSDGFQVQVFCGRDALLCVRSPRGCGKCCVGTAGATVAVALPQSVQLGNKGGIITLLNGDGWKVHGVSYRREQVEREGWTIVF